MESEMKYDLQSLSDIAEIRQLNASYNRAADRGDGPAYAAHYTEDAEFEIVGNRVYRGRDEIARAAASTTVTVHVTTEPEIELDGDTATQRVRMLSIVFDPASQRNEFVASGWYEDTLKRTGEGWKYHRRRASLDLDIQSVFAKMGIGKAFNELAAS
jgi:ketosteroid isomerase-like protein